MREVTRKSPKKTREKGHVVVSHFDSRPGCILPCFYFGACRKDSGRATGHPGESRTNRAILSQPEASAGEAQGWSSGMGGPREDDREGCGNAQEDRSRLQEGCRRQRWPVKELL